MSDAISGRNAPNFQAKSAFREHWLAAILADESLPRSAYRVAGAISKYLNSKTLECFPAVATLARLARYVDRTIQRLVKALCGAGYLRVERSAGRRGCNIYRAFIPGEIVEAEAQADAAAAEIATPSTTASPCTDAPPSRSSSTSSRVWAEAGTPLWARLAAAYEAATGRAPPRDRNNGWFFAPAS
jgi:hypothetical protein